MAQRRHREGVAVVEGAESKIRVRLHRGGQVKPSTSKSKRSKKVLRQLLHGVTRKFVGMRKRKSIAATTTRIPTTTNDNSEMGARVKDELSAEDSKDPASRRRSGGGSVSTSSTSSNVTPYSKQDSTRAKSPERDEDSTLPCQSSTTGQKADEPASDLGAQPPRRNSKSTNGDSFERGKGEGPPSPPPRLATPNKPKNKPLMSRKSKGAAHQTSRCSELPRRHSSGSLEQGRQGRVKAAETKDKLRLSSNRKRPSLEQRGLSSAFATVTKEAKARSVDAKGRKTARRKDTNANPTQRDPVRVPLMKSDHSLSAISNRDVFIYKVRRSKAPREYGERHQSPQEKTGSRGKPSNAVNCRRQKGSKIAEKVAESHQRPALPVPETSIPVISENILKQALDECIELLEDRLEMLEQKDSFNNDAVDSYNARESKGSPLECHLSIIPEEESHAPKSIGSSKTDQTAPSTDSSSPEISRVQRGKHLSLISCDSTVKVANSMLPR